MLDHPKPGAWVDEGFGLAGTHGVPAIRRRHARPHLRLAEDRTNGLSGALTVQGVWPKGVPSGFQAWYHYWLLDPVGVQGFAASNGRQSITQ